VDLHFMCILNMPVLYMQLHTWNAQYAKEYQICNICKNIQLYAIYAKNIHICKISMYVSIQGEAKSAALDRTHHCDLLGMQPEEGTNGPGRSCRRVCAGRHRRCNGQTGPLVATRTPGADSDPDLTRKGRFVAGTGGPGRPSRPSHPSRPFGSALGVAGARIWLKQKAHCHCVRRRWLPPYRPRRPGLAGQSTRLRRGKTAPGGLVAAAGVGRRAGGGGGGRRRTGFPPCSTRGRAGSGIRARPRRLGAATCVRGRFLADMQSIPNMQNKQQNTKYAINIPNMQKHTI
jgi:hypothetical protein